MTEPREKKSLFEILQEHFTSANVGETGVLMAYYLLLSIFPLMLALGNLLPAFKIDPTYIVPYFEALAPEEVRSVLYPIIEQLLTTGNGGLFSLGMVIVIWSASNGVGQLQKGLDHAYGIIDKRHNLVQKAMSVVAVIFMLLVVLAVIIVFGLGSILVETLSTTIPALDSLASGLSGLRWPVTIILLLSALTLLYMRAPAAKVRFRDALPGTIFAAIGMVVLVITFSLYLQLIARSLTTYGVLSTFFILMFWLNFSCIIVLLGAVLNATLYEYRHGELVMKKYPVSQRLSDKIEDLIRRLTQKKDKKPDEEPQ